MGWEVDAYPRSVTLDRHMATTQLGFFPLMIKAMNLSST